MSSSPTYSDPTARLLAVETDLQHIAGHLAVLGNQLAEVRRAGTAPRYSPIPEPTRATLDPALGAPAQPASQHRGLNNPVTPTAGPHPAAQLNPPPAPVAYERPTPWWQREGAVARLLSIAGAGVFLIGITLLLLLAIQNGYLGPVTRVVLGGAASATLVGIGALVHRRQPGNPGSVALAATGVAGGYLTVLAMTVIYAWVAVTVGLGLAAAVFAVGVFLTRIWHSQVLGVIVVVGVVALGPAMGNDHPPITALFVVVVSLGAILADPSRRWPVLQLTRVVPVTLLLIGLTFDSVPFGPVISATGPSVPLVASIFAVVTVLVELRFDRGLTLSLVTPVVVGIALLPALVAPLVAKDGSTQTIWLAIVAALAVAFTILAKQSATRAVLISAAALAGILSLATIDLDGLWVVGALAIAAALLAVGQALGQRTATWVGVGAALIGLLGYLPILDPLLNRGGNTFSGELGVWELLASAAGLGVVVLMARLVPSRTASRSGPARSFGLWAVALLFVTGLAVSTGVLLGRASGDVATGFLAGHAAATVLWMASAAWLLLGRRGTASDTSSRRTLGVVIAGVAVAKLMLFDLSTLDGFVRVVAFVLIGGALLAVGTLYRKTKRIESVNP